MVTTNTRTTSHGTVSMVDAEGNEYRVTLFMKEFQVPGFAPWQVHARWLQWEQDELEEQPDGAYLLPSTGTLIYPPGRLPGA